MISKSVEFYNEMVPLFGTIMMVANLLVIAPIAEEIALRGIVYTRVEKTTNAVTAIIAHAVANLPEFILYNKPDISSGVFGGLVILFACVFIIGVCVIHHINQEYEF